MVNPIEDISNKLEIASNLNNIDYFNMSKNAFRVSKNYNWEDISLSFYDLYQWILGSKKKPDFVID